jgi:hypothetical protein
MAARDETHIQLQLPSQNQANVDVPIQTRRCNVARGKTRLSVYSLFLSSFAAFGSPGGLSNIPS